MNARDKLLKLIDAEVLNANDVLTDILVNYLDIDQANSVSEIALIDNNLD